MFAPGHYNTWEFLSGSGGLPKREGGSGPMRIDLGKSAMSGAPRENIFVATDDAGQHLGQAVVVEYVNGELFPERPLNYFLILDAYARARDMLFGAAYMRALMLRRRKPALAARVYAQVSPRDPERLLFFTENGFLNDDASVVVRRVLRPGEWPSKPPVGTRILPMRTDTPEQVDALLRRMEPFSTTVKTRAWYDELARSPLCVTLAVLEEDRILGEAVVSGYGTEGRLDALYVLPHVRRRGIGRALLSAAREAASGSGYRTLVAEVWQRNRAAASLFESEGFEQAGQVALYPGINV